MMSNPYLAQQMREERVKDALRGAEQVRLIRAAKGAEVDDQAVLHGLLVKIRDLSLSLVSAHGIEPDLPVPQQR